jgi:hypothetical protein
MNKKLILFFAIIFGIGGAYVPMLWGDGNLLGGASILWSLIGGLVGIWLGVIVSKRYGD